jgi:pimeloyl-ACP methyl ester carboxylesterase
MLRGVEVARTSRSSCAECCSECLGGQIKHFAMRWLRIMVLLLLIAWGAAANQTPRVSFAVSPAQPLMDDRISILISGLPPSRMILMKAKSRAHDELWWRSEAVFNSKPDGTIDLHAQAPIAGTYSGTDEMGLFWSMKPDADTKAGDHSFFTITNWLAPIVTEIEATDSGQVLGSVTVERRFAKPGIDCTTVAENGIRGLLCGPRDGRRHPAVMVLGGSEGGFGLLDAAVLLASHGFSVMSLAYFGMNGLPSALQNIPVEYFGRAVQWMCARPEVDPHFVSVLGASRGAEAALLVGAIFPEVKAVVARSPSNVRWEGVTANHFPGGPAWTYGGKPLPYVRNRIPLWFAVQYGWDTLIGNPVRQTPLFTHDLEVFGDSGSVEIPVENIHGPVLLLSGRDDQIWPSSLMATRLMGRLQRYRHPYEDEHLSYERAGHWIPSEYAPTAGSRNGMKLAIGGTPEGTARAQADSWPKILRFLVKASMEQKSRP